MCGRFTLTDPDPDLVEQFQLSGMPNLPPRYNIAPTQPVAAIRRDRESMAREMVLFYWGLIPFWAKDPGIGARMINARAETAAEKPAFRAAFKRRRCLVVADGFYEWQKQEGGKQPFFIFMHDRKPFAFAGLWEHWESPDGSAIESCTLLTTQPNELVKPLHNRMPAILAPEDYDLWLDVDVQDVQRLQPLLRPFPASKMDAYAISRRVNRPENDDSRIIEPLSPAADEPPAGW